MTNVLKSTSSSNALTHAAAPALRGTWYEIDLASIRHNYRQLRGHLPSGVKIYACLKRNAYGCGAGAVAGALSQEGVDGFAVASLLDAMSIRDAGVRRPILLYPGVLPAAASSIEALDLTISISSVDELEFWRNAMKQTRAFIKIDLGFFRAGVTPQEAARLLVAAGGHKDVRIEGIYAHISELPNARASDATDQLTRMHAVLRYAEALGVRPSVAMMSSTEGVLSHPEMDLDAVDPGALFVGLPETGQPVRSVHLRPALTAISTSLVAVKRVDRSLGDVPEISGFEPGMILGVLGIGWGDGYPRDVPAGAEAIVRGRRAPLLPPTHLEHLRIDLTAVPEARFGDHVIILGRQGDHVISHEEIARLWGTDVVGLYGQLRDHVPRIYTDNTRTI